MESYSPLSSWGISIITIIFVIIILFLYYTKKITIVECIIWGFSTQSYYITFIGPTISAFYIISCILAIDSLFIIFKTQKRVSLRVIYLLGLPLISSIIAIIYFAFSEDTYYYIVTSKTAFYLRPFYFYFKQFFPIFLLGYRVAKEYQTYFLEKVFQSITNVIYVSCWIIIAQFLINFFFNNVDLNEIVGMKKRASMDYNGFVFYRPQAFFFEPKNFAAFISISIPIFLKERKRMMVFILIIIATLSLSQTFIAILIGGGFCFLDVKNKYSLRINIIISITSFFILTELISLSKDFIIDNYANNEEKLVYNIIMGRSVERYSKLDDTNGNETLFGMPLQKDLELPVVNFLKDNPIAFFLGFGPANTMFFPPKYFEGQWGYENRLENLGAVHMNMRWIFYTVEFGFFIFLFYLTILTNLKISNIFYKQYYSYLWIALFFNEIDILIIIMYVILYYEKNNYENMANI